MAASGATASDYGDAQARRRAALDAAADLLDAGGYGALTVRAVATRAGMSPGLIYQYFANKQDLFAALLEESQRELAEGIAALPGADGVAALLRDIIPATTRQWARVGHVAATWHDIEAAVSRESARGLRAASEAQFVQLRHGLERAAAAQGCGLRADPELIPFVWSGLTGVADTLVKDWAGSVEPEAFIAYSAAALARAITTEAVAR